MISSPITPLTSVAMGGYIKGIVKTDNMLEMIRQVLSLLGPSLVRQEDVARLDAKVDALAVSVAQLESQLAAARAAARTSAAASSEAAPAPAPRSGKEAGTRRVNVRRVSKASQKPN